MSSELGERSQHLRRVLACRGQLAVLLVVAQRRLTVAEGVVHGTQAKCTSGLSRALTRRRQQLQRPREILLNEALVRPLQHGL